MLINIMCAIGEIAIAAIIAWFFITQISGAGFGGLVVSAILVVMVIIYALVSIANALN